MDEFEALRAFPGAVDEPDLVSAKTALQGRIESESDRVPVRVPRRMYPWFVAPVAAALLGVGVAAWFASDGSSEPDLASAQALGILFGSADGRYIGAGSPSELASQLAADSKQGSVVITGVVESFATGRTYGVGFDYPDDPGIPTVIMAVAVSELHAGSLPTASDNTVYVEFEAATPERNAPDAAKAMADSVPAGTETVLYLQELGPGGTFPTTKITDDGAGHPADQPVFRVFSPQGFYFAGPSGGVVQPQEAMEYPEATLGDFVPSADSFPPGYSNPQVAR